MAKNSPRSCQLFSHLDLKLGQESTFDVYIMDACKLLKDTINPLTHQSIARSNRFNSAEAYAPEIK